MQMPQLTRYLRDGKLVRSVCAGHLETKSSKGKKSRKENHVSSENAFTVYWFHRDEIFTKHIICDKI